MYSQCVAFQINQSKILRKVEKTGEVVALSSFFLLRWLLLPYRFTSARVLMWRHSSAAHIHEQIVEAQLTNQSTRIAGIIMEPQFVAGPAGSLQGETTTSYILWTPPVQSFYSEYGQIIIHGDCYASK